LSVIGLHTLNALPGCSVWLLSTQRR